MPKESTRRFCQKCQLELISLRFHIWGFSGIKKSVLTIELFSEKSLRVYTSIFPEISTFSFDRGIPYTNTIYKSDQVPGSWFWQLKMLEQCIGGPNVDLAKIGILRPQILRLHVLGSFSIRNSLMTKKTCQDILHVD